MLSYGGSDGDTSSAIMYLLYIVEPGVVFCKSSDAQSMAFG